MRGLTQAELAQRVGVGENSIARYERNEMTPSLTVGHTIAKVLGVTEAELLQGPSKNELKINILWEVTEEMNELTIKPNEFSIGLRSDGQYLLYGALPASMSVDEIIERIRKELAFAEKMRKMREHGGD